MIFPLKKRNDIPFLKRGIMFILLRNKINNHIVFSSQNVDIYYTKPVEVKPRLTRYKEQ